MKPFFIPEVQTELDKIGYQAAMRKTPLVVCGSSLAISGPCYLNPATISEFRRYVDEMQSAKVQAQRLLAFLEDMDDSMKFSVFRFLWPDDYVPSESPGYDEPEAFSDAFGDFKEKLVSLISSLESQIEMRMDDYSHTEGLGGRPKLTLARDVAIEIATIYYLGTGKHPGVGQTNDQPNGPYGRCVQAVFKHLGIKADWQEPAKAGRSYIKSNAGDLDEHVRYWAEVEKTLDL